MPFWNMPVYAQKEGVVMIEYIRKAFGVKGEITYQKISKDRYAIYVDGEYFGIFDTNRNTFVD